MENIIVIVTLALNVDTTIGVTFSILIFANYQMIGRNHENTLDQDHI